MFWNRKKKIIEKYEPLEISFQEVYFDYDYLGYSNPYFTDEENVISDSLVLLFYEHKVSGIRKLVQIPKIPKVNFEHHDFYKQCLVWSAGHYLHRHCILSPSKLFIERMNKEGLRLHRNETGETSWVREEESSDQEKKYQEAVVEQKVQKISEKVIKVDFSKKKD